MPTLNPRITVTLQPQVHAVMKRLSELTGNSQSALIGELLLDSIGVFERMVEVLDAAQKLKAQGTAMPEQIGQSLGRAQARIESQLGLVLDDWDHGNTPLLKEAEKIDRRGTRVSVASRASSRAKKTPLSNRGVTPQPTKAKGKR